MQLPNLKVDRIIIHQIYRRDQDGNKVIATQSHEYTLFAQEAMETFIKRIKDALGEGSKAIPMEIVNQDPSDLPSLIDNMIDQDNDSFAVSSFDIAKKLNNVQLSRSIPGGIIVVFCGNYGSQLKKFLGIIKAEVHSGYEKEVNEKTKEISLKFVEELLLTPGTRLYKTAGFFEKNGYDENSTDLNDKFAIMVSDYQIGKTDGKAAAHYFYSDFLGCGYPQTSARTTQQFYESTSSFISKLNVTEAEKSDLFNALTTYLKVKTSSTIGASDFGEEYFDLDTQDEYTEFVEEAGLPTTAFTKDLEHIESKLKFRKVNFRSNIKIIAPSEAFKELVTIERVEGDKDETGTPAEWTKVIIKDKITKQE
jgi:hypothetical protein